MNKKEIFPIFLLFVFILFIGCSNKNTQSIPINEAISINENQDQTRNYFFTDSEIQLNQGEIIKQLGKTENKLLNINNLFEIEISENIEIVSISQYLDRSKTQYCITNSLDVIYQNKHFYLDIDCYGNTNSAILKNNEFYNLKKLINPSLYKSMNQIGYLKSNYVNDPSINKNDIKIGKFVSHWGTSWTSDYYGVYFILPNSEFNECVISIDNVWYTFAQNETLEDDEDYKNKILREGGNLEKIFRELEMIENSITFNLSDDSIKIENGRIGGKNINDEYIFPAIDNLRMRNKPSLTGEILGYMENKIYQVIVIGEDVEIEGIKGNWIMIIPHNGNSVSWVFNGFTREATDEECYQYFGG
jgi:hypothetical protein